MAVVRLHTTWRLTPTLFLESMTLQGPLLAPAGHLLGIPADAHVHCRFLCQEVRLGAFWLCHCAAGADGVCVVQRRLSWLALHGTPATGLYVCALVYNLLQRHPTCVPMIQRKRKSTSEAAKGNEAFAPPAALSVDDRVIKSSLYELTGLRSHYCAPLASMASVFEKALDKPPYNLEVRGSCLGLMAPVPSRTSDCPMHQHVVPPPGVCGAHVQRVV